MFYINSWAIFMLVDINSLPVTWQSTVKLYAVVCHHHSAWVKFLCVPLTAEIKYTSQGNMVFTTEGQQRDYYTQKIQFLKICTYGDKLLHVSQKERKTANVIRNMIESVQDWAGRELIFFLVAGTLLYFAFKMRMMLIILWCFSWCWAGLAQCQGLSCLSLCQWTSWGCYEG